MRILDLSVYGVHPARSAGHLAILEPLRYLAQQGHEVEILSLGLRSFEKRFPRRFQVEIAPRLRETRLVSALSLLKAQLLGKTRFPPLTAAGAFAERSRPEDTALLARADLVILESPWAFAFARSATRAPILWIAHNQEARLHQEVLREAGLLERAREIEGECYREVDLVLTLHEADANGLREDYGNRKRPLEILPLGCDIHQKTDPARRLAARESLGLQADARVALFAGSAHAPNVRAADRLEALAPDLAEAGWEILIAGSVRSSPRTFVGGRVTGPLEDLTSCYEACDLAVNPVEEGSGMNVKNLHAMARGLPVLCSPVGARGFTSGEEAGLLEVDTGDLVTRLRELTARPESVEALSVAAHETARARYSWPAIVEARLAFVATHLPTGSTSG
jgi:glycosyltransferase involved in cell wall biosynthesis